MFEANTYRLYILITSSFQLVSPGYKKRPYSFTSSLPLRSRSASTLNGLPGCVSFFCTQEGGGKIGKNDQERGESMKGKKNKRGRSAQIKQASAGLRDVMGMTQTMTEHPKAT